MEGANVLKPTALACTDGKQCAPQKSGAPWREPGRGGFSLPGLGGVGEALARGAGTLKVKGFGRAPTDGDEAVSRDCTLSPKPACKNAFYVRMPSMFVCLAGHWAHAVLLPA